MEQENAIPLSELDIGQSGKIVSIKGTGASRRRLIDLGMTKGSIVQVAKKAPFGDPLDFIVKGYHLSLRKSEAENILVMLLK
jgi:ferrous iron transport protein A